MKCPVDSCNYTSSEHGVKVHKGRVHEKNSETCVNCGDEFHRAPAKTREQDKSFCSRSCCSKYRTGENNPNGTNSATVVCSYCGNKVSRPKSVINRGQDNHYCDDTCQSLHWHEHGIQSGSDNPMYGGGSDWRSRAKWRNLRNKVVDDSCRICSDSETLHVHHKLPVYAGGPKYDEDNLMTVCRSCHVGIHRQIDTVFL